MKTEGKRNLLRQPDEIRLMTGGAQTEQETASDAAAFRAGDVTVELAEADGSLAVFVQAQNGSGACAYLESYVWRGGRGARGHLGTRLR